MPTGNRAVVIGGSMMGILAARALADHFEQVLLLERDTFPPIGDHRRGVPQARHTHGCLASGRQVFEHWFPGFSDEMFAAGAVSGDIVRDTRWFFEGGCYSRPTSGLKGILCSRPFLEGMLRARIRALSNLQIRENAQVGELIANADKSRVIGVRVAEESIPADLVVDTTGRGSKTPRWLEALGYPLPAEERVEIALAYTTRFFRRSPKDMNGDLAAIIPSTPAGKRGGVMIAQEGDRWTVTMIGHFGNDCPPDLPGFLEFAKSLPAPYIYEVLLNAEPLDEPVLTRFPASVRRRYESLKRFPEGFLVMGDAISSFNPIYGQGMSVAALESRALDDALRQGTQNLAARFFSKAAKVVDVPWSIASGNDLRMPEVVGKRSLPVRFINWYLAKYHKAAQKDPQLAIGFHKVANLLTPPPTLFHPRLLWRVWKGRRNKTTVPYLVPSELSQ